MMTIENEQWEIISGRDASFDGRLYYGVASTGIYCRPSCPSKRPKPENVRFFDSPEAAERSGFRPCRRCKPRAPASAAALVRKVTDIIAAHPGESLTLEQLSGQVGVSPFHLQRTFKKATGITPKAYMEEQRSQRFGRTLPETGNVTEAIYDAGFGASSRAYERSGAELGMKPGERRKHGAGVAIRFTLAPTEFGQLLVAVTDRGVCAVRLGDSASELETDFRKDFAQGILTRDDGELAGVVDQILVLTSSSAPHPQIPLDVRATAFQRRVWQYLREIPRGETRCYSQIAADLGAPLATRAVARACATNEVSLIIPCHRVIGKNGSVTGYRWGVERKRQLLEKERG